MGCAVGDFDGDAKPDVVTANRGTRNFSVLLNNGDGAFASPATYPHGGASPERKKRARSETKFTLLYCYKKMIQIFPESRTTI